MSKTPSPFDDQPDRIVNYVKSQGSLLSWKVRQPYIPVTPPKRGPITRFTDACRMRMLRFIATIDWLKTGKCLFMTLTYPDDVVHESYARLQKQKDLMQERIETHLGRHNPAMWRLEWKPRLTGRYIGQAEPHWHWILFGTKWIDKEWVNSSWKEVIGWTGYNRTEVKGMKNKKQVGYYVSKYSAKVDSSLVNDPYHRTIPSGRQWGKLREPLIHRHTAFEVLLPDSELTGFARDYWIDRRKREPKWENPSFTCLGPLAEEIGQIVFGCSLDEWCIDV